MSEPAVEVDVEVEPGEEESAPDVVETGDTVVVTESGDAGNSDAVVELAAVVGELRAQVSELAAAVAATHAVAEEASQEADIAIDVALDSAAETSEAIAEAEAAAEAVEDDMAPDSRSTHPWFRTGDEWKNRGDGS